MQRTSKGLPVLAGLAVLLFAALGLWMWKFQPPPNAPDGNRPAVADGARGNDSFVSNVIPPAIEDDSPETEDPSATERTDESPTSGKDDPADPAPSNPGSPGAPPAPDPAKDSDKPADSGPDDALEDLIDRLDPDSAGKVHFSAVIRGTVVTAAGEPAAGASVRVFVRRELGESYISDNTFGNLNTDADSFGVFTVEIQGDIEAEASVICTLTASMRGVPASPDVVVKPGNGDSCDVELKLGGHGGISGRVLDEVGLPVAGAIVSLDIVQDATDIMNLRTGGGPSYTSTTDHEGRFEFASVRTDRWKPKVNACGFSLVEEAQAVDVEAGVAVTLPDLTMKRVSALRFIPKYEDDAGRKRGRPPSWSMGSIKLRDADGNETSHSLTGDSEGAQYANEIPPGTYTATLQVVGQKPREFTVEIRDGQVTDLGEVLFEESGLTG